MSKKTRHILVTGYLLLGIAGIHMLGEVYASKMMEILTENPSPDLYANDYGFQYVAFWFPWGVVLAFGLVSTAILLRKALDRENDNA